MSVLSQQIAVLLEFVALFPASLAHLRKKKMQRDIRGEVSSEFQYLIFQNFLISLLYSIL